MTPTPDTALAARLLPCPFCGGEAAFGANTLGAFVNCVECLAASNHLTDAGNSNAGALAEWNTRADLIHTLPSADYVAGLDGNGDLIGSATEIMLRGIWRQVAKFHNLPLDGVVEADLVRAILVARAALTTDKEPKT